MAVSVFIGLGRVGLPQALVAAEAGHTIYGFDRETSLVADLQVGRPPFYEPGLELLLQRHLGQGFHPITQKQLPEVVPLADYVVVAIGVPRDHRRSSGSGGLRPLVKVAGKIFPQNPKPGVTILLRSTVPIGTTDCFRESITTTYGLEEGKDFHLVYAPERLAEGNAIEEERNLPRLLGAYTDEGFERARLFFRHFGGKVIRLSSPTAVELAKLTDNSFRDTHFAFANEISHLAEALGLDALEIIQACNSEYQRNQIPVPGPVSGYCLSKDPWSLESEFKRRRFSAHKFDSLWAYGRRVNELLNLRAAEGLVSLLHPNPDGHTIAILGLSYKEDVDDFRASHTLEMVRHLRQMIPGARFVLYDPALGTSSYAQVPQALLPDVVNQSRILDYSFFQRVNGILVATRHRSLREAGKSRDSLTALLGERSHPLAIYDCWNIWRVAEGLPHVSYRALGKGLSVGRR